ncbi:hypothetical protein KM043_003955 [Ampulex compressa]|nr:hypothetical protein KM043_003955 [Ampulex compressa]
MPSTPAGDRFIVDLRRPLRRLWKCQFEFPYNRQSSFDLSGTSRRITSGYGQPPSVLASRVLAVQANIVIRDRGNGVLDERSEISVGSSNAGLSPPPHVPQTPCKYSNPLARFCSRELTSLKGPEIWNCKRPRYFASVIAQWIGPIFGEFNEAPPLPSSLTGGYPCQEPRPLPRRCDRRTLQTYDYGFSRQGIPLITFRNLAQLRNKPIRAEPRKTGSASAV